MSRFTWRIFFKKSNKASNQDMIFPCLFYFFETTLYFLYLQKRSKIKSSCRVKFHFSAKNRYKIPVKTIRNEQVVGSSPIASSIRKSRLPGISRKLFLRLFQFSEAKQVKVRVFGL